MRHSTFKRQTVNGNLLPLLIYLALAIMLTWPLAAHLSTHLPGDGGDDPAIAWNFWWVKFVLLNQGQAPFFSDFLFYPVGINLAFYTLTVLNALTALPLTLNLGVVTASNLHTLFTFVTGGYGAFLLTYHALTTARDPIPATNRQIWLSALVAGGFYAFASNKLFYVALGQFNIASTHWIPFAVLYTLRTQQQPQRLKNALLTGLFFTLQAWAEMTYASFLLVFIALYWLYWLAQLAPHRQGVALKALGLTGLTSTLGLAPILAYMLPDLLAEGDFTLEGGGFADVFSADLLGFIIPTMHHPFLGQLISTTSISAFNKGQHIYLGVTLLVLLLVAMLTGYRRADVRFWLLATAVFALLCLGPVIAVNGHATGLVGPFVLLQKLPIFKANRYPSRYSVMLLLSLSVLSAYALTRLSNVAIRRSLTGHSLIILAGLLFIAEHLSVPLPLSDMQLPDPYRLIAADPDDVTVLDIPFAWRNGFRITGALTTQFMFGQFYQTAHQKRLLQGNTSRNPEFKFQYFTDAPVINSLLALETGKTLPPEQWTADRTIAANVLRFFNIRYIVVRSEPADNPAVTPQATIPYIESLFPVRPLILQPDLRLYQVDLPPDETTPPLEVTSASPLAPLYFGEGWGRLTPDRPLVAQRQTVRLILPLTGQKQRLTLRLRLPDEAAASTVDVRVQVYGWQSPPQTVTRDWRELQFDLPAGAARPGLNNLYLRFSQTTPIPRQTNPPHITVLSAGQEVGDFGHIYLNGRDVSPNQRGYNVAVITANGRLLQAASFDTHLDPAASGRLVDFLSTAPAESLIAIAAADEASASLTEAAVQALQHLGATVDLRGCFRCSHALLIDRRRGIVQESSDPLRPTAAVQGYGLTEPAAAALVDSIVNTPTSQ